MVASLWVGDRSSLVKEMAATPAKNGGVLTAASKMLMKRKNRASIRMSLFVNYATWPLLYKACLSCLKSFTDLTMVSSLLIFWKSFCMNFSRIKLW